MFLKANQIEYWVTLLALGRYLMNHSQIEIRNQISLVLMAERSRAYVYDSCHATKTNPCSNPLATYET